MITPTLGGYLAGRCSDVARLKLQLATVAL